MSGVELHGESERKEGHWHKYTVKHNEAQLHPMSLKTVLSKTMSHLKIY